MLLSSGTKKHYQRTEIGWQKSIYADKSCAYWANAWPRLAANNCFDGKRKSI
ncbi:MAG: hypothetical protein H6Q74_2962 [Firmicutes bacterium]|nr:hypothetical protein [Bacillota bacterium]